MATFRGISAVGDAVLSLLTEAWKATAFEARSLETKFAGSEDLTTPPTKFGVSLYVYRVLVNGTQRTLPPSQSGHRRPLPVEVDFILTPWAGSAQKQLELLGWCMRALEDDPILPPALLNARVPGIFGSDEIVEIVPAALASDEYFRLWDALTVDYQLSVAYAARVVRLESDRQRLEAGPVLERELDLGVLVDS